MLGVPAMLLGGLATAVVMNVRARARRDEEAAETRDADGSRDSPPPEP